MKKLFTSTVLTVAAVPFLVAAPNAVKKTQNQAPAATQTGTMTAKPTAKKHVKKMKSTAPASSTAGAPAAPAQK